MLCGLESVNLVRKKEIWWYTIVHYNTVHYSTIQYSAVQYSTVQYNSTAAALCVVPVHHSGGGQAGSGLHVSDLPRAQQVMVDGQTQLGADWLHPGV